MSAAAPRSGFTPQNIELREFRFDRLPSERWPSDPEKLSPPRLSFESKVALDRDQHVLHVFSRMSTVDPEDGDQVSPVSLSALIVTEFTWEEPLSMPVEKFASMNAAAFAWPYLRELVWNFTVRGNLPPLLLPMLNFSAEGAEIEERHVRRFGEI